MRSDDACDVRTTTGGDARRDASRPAVVDACQFGFKDLDNKGNYVTMGDGCNVINVWTGIS